MRTAALISRGQKMYIFLCNEIEKADFFFNDHKTSVKLCVNLVIGGVKLVLLYDRKIQSKKHSSMK